MKIKDYLEKNIVSEEDVKILFTWVKKITYPGDAPNGVCHNCQNNSIIAGTSDNSYKRVYYCGNCNTAGIVSLSTGYGNDEEVVTVYSDKP